jgi:5'-3' exonuclease
VGVLQLLDLAGLYFRAFYAVPASLTGPHGRPVNAIRGSLDMIAKVVTDARPTRVIACLDIDWRPAWRVELIPSYKTHRVAGDVVPGAGGADPRVLTQLSEEQVPDDLSPQVPVLLDVLAAIGVAQAGAPEAEADDVIGTLVERETRDPVEVVTGDRDLMQLARTTPTPVAVRYIGAGLAKAEVLDEAGVQRKYGIPASGYADFALLRGDPSDGLPGVPGIGDKTAAALISAWGSVEALAAAADDPRSGLGAGPRKKLTAAREYLDVAPRVVRVARDAAVWTEPDGDGRIPDEPADPERLASLITEHGIGTSVKRLLDALGWRG